MMTAVKTVDLKVRDKRSKNVSALIKMFEPNPEDLTPKHVSELIKLFESKHYDLAQKRRQNTVVVSDGGPYEPSDVTGTWVPIQSCGDGSRVKKKVENSRRMIMPGPGSVKKLIARFGGSTMPATTTDR